MRQLHSITLHLAPNLLRIAVDRLMAIASFLQHPLILFLGAAALAAPLGPEEVAAELPDAFKTPFTVISSKHLKVYAYFLTTPSKRPTPSRCLPNSQFHPTCAGHTPG